MKRQILPGVLILLFIASFATADTIHVPGAFPYIDIQTAINISQSGDVIIIAPGTYPGYGDQHAIAYSIGKGITITGTDPNDPAVVAATVIDMYEQHSLAFELYGPRSVLSGITIANSWRWYIPPVDGVDPGDDGHDNEDWRGHVGINIRGNHIITNCIIRNLRMEGGRGGNGAAGGIDDDPEDPNTYIPISYGGDAGDGGSRYGAGIYIDYGSPQILNTVVEDCIAIGGPGGAGGAGFDADIDDANLPGGDGGNGGWGGDAMGAGIYINSGSPTFKNCIIRNCQVYPGDANDGGAGGDGAIEEPNDDNPGGRGGSGGQPGRALGAGVYVDGGVSATFIDCQFIGNRAYGGIAGDGNDAGDTHADMDWIHGGQGGTADYRTLGAGVYIDTSATATFTGCTFSDNVIRGGVSGMGGWPNWGHREQPRRNYPAPSYGAGIYCAPASTTTFTDCTVQGNWTTKEPNQYEGDLYPYGSHPDPVFDYADTEYTGYGAGMCFVNGDVKLNNCNIADNNAPVGGGVFASALTDFHVDDCNFVNNWAYLGAGLFSIDNNSTISSSTFTGNRADDPNGDLYGSGGGLFSFSTDVLISDCTFSENTTNGLGGGIYMAGEVAIPPLTAEPVLKNCLVSNNEAGFDGGGIYCDWYTKPNIINCTITGNEAIGYGGGLYCSYGSDVNIINSIFWGNAGTIGPELAVETWPFFAPTTLTVSYCDIEDGQAGTWVDDDSTLNWDVDPVDPNYPTNIDADPLFVTGPVGDYYLSQTDANSASYPGQDANSPCVDAGKGSAADLGLQHYTTRTDNIHDVCDVDMGYHYPIITLEVSCDFDIDGDVDLADLAILMWYWLEQDCDLLAWCEGTDLDRDTDVDFVDYAFFAQVYESPEPNGPPPADTDPPQPDPSEWEIAPYPLSSSEIGMTATEADDPSGGVQYQFECVSGGGHSSGWQDSREYTDTGLAALTEYCYRVRTRDVYNNTGNYSEPEQCATTLP